MNVLGIETATVQVGCAIGGDEGIYASFHAAKGRHHAEILTPAIDFTVKQARMELSEINAVAVDIGPGLFTGLRVGIATAKAVAFALDVPMIGLSSLDLMAYAARWSNHVIVPVIDARRGEVFWAQYQKSADGIERLGEYRVGTAEDLVGGLQAQGQPALLIGDGAERYRDAFATIAGIEIGGVGQYYPSATALVEMAHPQAARNEVVRAEEIEPLYLRKSDAEVNRDKAEAAAVADRPLSGASESGQ